ncbi:MAG TPA: hypothetical protein VEU33_16865, partial [Archangium sp.]|nr:hypothetical protein [Archangium sp.]
MNRWREKSVVIAALVLGGSPGARAADEACRIGDGQRIILQLADEKTSLNKAKGTKVENESDNYHVRISIGGMPAYSVQVDTGSMGIVVSRSAVPDALWNAASDRPGQMYYSSSDRLMLGRYVTAPVKLGVPRDYKGAESGGDYPTTASIDVLAVECSCHTHPQTTGSSSTSAQEPLTGESLSCKQLEGTSAQLGGKSATLNRCVPARTGMMGVGFARGGHLSSAKNPFLRLEAMDKGLMHPGYIIRGRAHELELGLTKNGTADFKFVQLQLQSQAGSEPPSSNPGPGTLRYVKEWEAPRACVDFPGQKSEYRQFCGTLLMDTGIDEMLLTVPGNMRPPNLV